MGEVIELDVTDPDADRGRRARGRSSVSVASTVWCTPLASPPVLPRLGMLGAPFEDVATGHADLDVLAGASWERFARSCESEASGGASVIALDFDATRAYPMYDWMGVMKAGLESLATLLVA